MTKELLLIFVRKPELGKVKTRLAATVGNQAALSIYECLLKHTLHITKNLNVTKQVYYTENISENDLWDPSIYDKKQQYGAHLGARMEFAFDQGFKAGYQNIVIIGSDIIDLTQADLISAFAALKTHDKVIGPAKDGGYYLLGMKKLNPDIFRNKTWGTDTVYSATMKDLEGESIFQLDVKNDIDRIEDLNPHSIFDQFLTNKDPN